VEVLQRLANLFAQSNDAIKCAETLQKLIDVRRERGTQMQLVDALSLLLPESALYEVLSNIPPPEPTKPAATTIYAAQAAIHNSLPILEEIIAILEKDEDEALKREVDKRRMRLGAAGPEQLKKEVGREIWSTSRLPALYEQVLNHPSTSDELRRLTDAKLLRYEQRYLYSLPSTEKLVKEQVANQLDSLVNGAVILRIPDELAWMLYFDGKDAETIEDYSLSSLRQFMNLFPLLPLTSLLKGYFTYMDIPIVDRREDDSGSESDIEVFNDDPFDTILNAHSMIPDSILANRILASVYLQELDYQNAINVAETGLELLHTAEANRGRNLPHVRLGLQVVLATSLVHLFPPKHHTRALSIIDQILSHSPNNAPGLMGRAYILQHSRRWEEAGNLFAKVASLLHDDLQDGIRAVEEEAWCQCESGKVESGLLGLQTVFDTVKDLEGRDSDCARCLWRLGMGKWKGTGRRDFQL